MADSRMLLFDYYLVDRIFEIETDHRPLVAILGVEFTVMCAAI